jgi:hypothetical protein
MRKVILTADTLPPWRMMAFLFQRKISEFLWRWYVQIALDVGQRVHAALEKIVPLIKGIVSFAISEDLFDRHRK